MSRYFTAADVKEIVERTTRDQGVARRLTDPDALGKVATIVRGVTKESARWARAEQARIRVPGPYRLRHRAEDAAVVYGLVDPATGEVRYVGSTSDPARRLYEHRKRPDWRNWQMVVLAETTVAHMFAIERTIKRRYEERAVELLSTPSSART